MRRPPLVSPRNFLAGLSPDDFESFRKLMTRVTFAPNEVLFHQGDQSGETYFIDEGKVELTIRLPGGGETVLATLHEGEILGELALLSDSPRAATARAVGTVRALVADRVDFRAMLAYFHPASLAVLRRIVLLLVSRLQDRLLQFAPQLSASGGDPEPNIGRPGEEGAGFDLGPFLTKLPFFKGFTHGDVAWFFKASGAHTWRLARGRQLLYPGHSPRAVWLVLRGAVELTLGGEGDAMRRVGVLGPGNVVGEEAVLLGANRLVGCRTREDSVLLEIEAEKFVALFDGEERVSFKLLEGMVSGLVQRLGQLGRVRGRLEQELLTGAAPTQAPRNVRARVMVVDDSEMNRALLRLHVEEMGHEVIEAHNGRVALDALALGGADAILLDVTMPVLDGYATLETLQADPTLRQIPVIMITSVDSLDSAIRCLRLGAEDYLPRSFDEQQLRARLDTCLRRTRVLP